MLPSKEKLHRGKVAAINKLKGNLGDYMIACVDSDYDYLLQDSNESSTEINNNQYIFQTYLYSIENFKCKKDLFKDYCINTTYNRDIGFNFDLFFDAYSSLIYEIHIILLYCLRNNDFETYTFSDFCKDISIDRFFIENNGKETLNEIEQKVTNRLKNLNEFISSHKPEIDDYRLVLNNLGLDKTNSYLFVQGHALMNNVTLMILKPIARKLYNEVLFEIKAAEADKKNIEDRRLQYMNQTGTCKKGAKIEDRISHVVKNNYDFNGCKHVERIVNDLNVFLAKR